MTEQSKSVEYEYAVDSQWSGWWSGYGAERLPENEIKQRASKGWRLVSTESRPFWWWGVSIVPPSFVSIRNKILYIFERAKKLAYFHLVLQKRELSKED